MPLLADRLRAAGAKPLHVERAWRVWLSGAPLAEACEEPRLALPREVNAGLAELDRALDDLARVVAAHPAGDGGERLELALADGRGVECVLLPRDGLCVSTQVGCAVGCTFCMTGREGLARQLGADEILAQVVLARRRRRVRRVVFMGMGEPLHNLEAVLGAIERLGLEGRVGHKDLVFSTVGEPCAFERLAAGPVKPALALSLHTTDAERRARLLPRAPRVEPEALVRAALAYAKRTGHALQVQWTLLAGVNDGDDELERLIPWLRGHRVVVNYIPFHPVPGAPFERVHGDRSHELTRALHRGGVVAKLRESMALEVDGACGQLRSRRPAASPS